MSDEVKTRVSIEGADQAVSDVTRLVETEKKRTDATRAATEETQKATKAVEQASKAQKEQSESTAEMVGEWIKFVGIGQSIIAVFEGIRDRAKEAVEQAMRLADVTNGLATNVGGRLSDELVGEINTVAQQTGIGVTGRNALIEAMGAATDARDMTPEQQKTLIQELAVLDSATGLRGKQGFNTLNAISSVFKLSDDSAVSILTGMANQGFGPDVVQNAVEKGRDTRFLLLMSAARQNLDPGTIGRQFQGLMTSLDRRGDDGGLAEDLQALGLNDQMSAFDRWSFLVDASNRGEITEGQFSQATGGQSTVALREPFRAAMRTGFGQAGRDVYVDPQKEIQKRFQSPSQRSRAIIETARLKSLVKKESEGVSPAAVQEALLQLEAEDDSFVRFLRAIPGMSTVTDAVITGASQFSTQNEIDKTFKSSVPKAPVIINNYYTNSILNGTDPSKAPDDVKRQD